MGGVDGTTRNRFKGSLAAKHVRAKTGTLIGKSCLSGYVGDGSDVLVFSILVDGLSGKGLLRAVRGAQVGAVNAMMRYVREGAGQLGDLPAGLDDSTATDYENGDEQFMETDGEVTEGGEILKPREDAVDAVLRKERATTAKSKGSGRRRRRGGLAQPSTSSSVTRRRGDLPAAFSALPLLCPLVAPAGWIFLAADRSASALLVRSQKKSPSARPK